MTALEIIEQLKALSRDERARVVAFLRNTETEAHERGTNPVEPVPQISDEHIELIQRLNAGTTTFRSVR